MTATFALRLHDADNVAIVLRDCAAAEVLRVADVNVTVQGAISCGHKVALRPIASGEVIVKYGFPIGVVTQDIAAGEHVHVHNVKSALAEKGEYSYRPAPEPRGGPSNRLSWKGYLREDGQAATRNEIWILPTVGCVSRTAERIAAMAQERFAGQVDGAHAFGHPFGCSQLGDDLDATRGILAALACNPNAGGVLILGLGCESNQIDALLDRIPPQLRAKVRTLSCQSAGDEVEEGLELVAELADMAGKAERISLPLAKLSIGLKCGGSDGFSGLTANPLLGYVTDAVTGAGGRAILTEIPEIFGAEQLLMQRAASRAQFDALVHLVNGFKAYFTSHGEPVSENPSPGNIAGGITTLEEKSLGAVQKGGRATVSDVLPYGGRAEREGLSVLEAPGNDAVSSTALAAAGANLILFTTGRGTPLGFPVPTVKVASNRGLAERKPQWIDFDAGSVLEQGVEPVAERLLERIAAIASGEMTAAERAGHREIAIWKRGVTL